MQANHAVRRLRLRSIENTEAERHASWLELFFDLIFVLAVAQVAYSLNQDFTFGGFFRYLALFAPVWWAWVGYSFYADRFESEDVLFRLMMFAAMLAMAALAVNVQGAFQDKEVAFAISYFVVRFILIMLYLRAAWQVPLARELCVSYLTGFALGAGCWFASIFVPPPVRFILWGVGFFIELLTPFINNAVARRTPYDASHIPERFGLFTLIVIGEAVLTGVTGLAGMNWQLNSTIIGACGFAIAASIWWIYYDFVETSGIRQGDTLAKQIYMYGHFAISVGVAAVGVATQHSIKEAAQPALPAITRWLLCGSVALFLMTTICIRLSARRRHLVWSRLATSAIAISLAAFGQHLAPILLIALLLAALIGEVWLESVKKEQVMESCEVEEVTHIAKCTHITQIREVIPMTPGCEECLAGHYQWVHLRLCQICGHVGCCDSSKLKHATKHFEETGHPIIKSLEPGENWAWCYIDETYA